MVRDIKPVDLTLESPGRGVVLSVFPELEDAFSPDFQQRWMPFMVVGQQVSVVAVDEESGMLLIYHGNKKLGWTFHFEISDYNTSGWNYMEEGAYEFIPA